MDDDPSLRWVMGEALRQAGQAPRDFNSTEELLAALKEATPDVLITDIHLPGENGLDLLHELRTAGCAVRAPS